MSKHRLSPAPLPPSKRLHGAGGSYVPLLPSITFESALYDELVLCIFSYLSYVDLCMTQSTSRNWARLAADNELWRDLYLSVFGRPRLRGARGFIGRTDGREVRSLPGRAKTEDHKDWKWMFRISSNWRTGRCLVEQCRDDPLFAPPDPALGDEMHILLAGPITVLASSRASMSPNIHLWAASGARHALSCSSSRQGHSIRITALCLDQSSPASGDIRFAAFLSTGEFTIYHANHSHLSSSLPRISYVPSSRIALRNCRITHAVYHHPLLISLSEDFTLSLYDISSDNVVSTQILTSFSSYPPASLVLSTPSASTYKLVLAYGIHVYPHHWSVGATELVIAGREAIASRLSMLAPDHDPMTVTSTRTIRSFDIPSGWMDKKKLQSMREQWGRKVASISDTETDGKWVVLAPTEERAIEHPLMASSIYSPTTLQLYRLSLPTTASVASGQPKLTFVRNLHGQMGPVSSMALADGRCVSLGFNGSVWVWDLEAGTGAQVCEPSGSVSSSKCTLIFDERRVVIAGPDGVVVRRFDV